MKNIHRNEKRNELLKNFKMILKIYNAKIIVLSVIIFLMIIFLPFSIIPDYFELSKIENPRGFVWNLLTVTLGFSGLVLTILLLTYNLYFKSTRRNTIEFIIENSSFKILLSAFVSIIILHFLGFCFIGSSIVHNKITLLYFLLFTTALFILAQFPLVILTLKSSTSIKKIQARFEKITQQDIDSLYKPSEFLGDGFIEHIERNQIIFLKDIGTTAIKENDWILPQAILQGFFKILSINLEKQNVENKFKSTFYCFLFICDHFKKVAIKNSDHITANVIYSYIHNLYHILVEKNVLNIYYYRLLDDFLKEFAFEVIRAQDFVEIRDHILKDYIKLMTKCTSIVKYSDKELPTTHYYRTQKDYSLKEAIIVANHLWQYLTREQINTLNDIVEFSISKKDNRVYGTFHWHFDSLLTNQRENLTYSQKISYIEDIFYKIEDVSFFAIKNGILNDVEIVSHITIVEWIKMGEKGLYYKGLFYYAKLLKKTMFSTDVNLYFDHFFMIGRQIAHDSSFKQTLKNEIVSFIIDTAIKISESMNQSVKLKYELQYQLNWLCDSFIYSDEKFDSVKTKYENIISKLLADFDFSNFPDY